MASGNTNNIPYRFDDDTAKSIEKIKKITGIKVTTKAITKAVVEYSSLVEDLDKAHTRIEELEELLRDIKQAQQTKLEVSKTLEELIDNISE